MYLVQLLLPVEDSLPPSADSVLEKLKRELASRFGGFTAFTQAPAEGLWAPGSGPEERDRIIVVEVMTDSLDRRWWHALRLQLEDELHQDLLVVRARTIEML